MKTTPIAIALPVLGAFALSGAPAASAQVAGESAVSGNWAGYVAGDTGSSFSRVSGSWVQPSVKCTAGQTDSAYWVGLGGASGSSGALEQTGTEANCGQDGTVSNYAWYELVPAAPVKLPVAIKPGDHVTGTVTVSGTTVTVTIDDTTTGQSSTKTLTMQDPDTSTAEWIAEAPSVCQGNVADGQCQPLPLADFGTVKFSGSSATAGGDTGTINDSQWSAEPISLNPQADGTLATAGAEPSSLSADGSSFAVAYDASATSGSTSSTGGYGNSGYGNPYSNAGGYGSVDPYGGYDPYGSAGGYGYGAYGYGGYGYGYGDAGDGGYGYSSGYGNPYASAGGYGGTYSYSSGDGYSDDSSLYGVLIQALGI